MATMAVVRCLGTVQYERTSHAPGTELSVPEDEATRLVQLRAVEYVDLEEPLEEEPPADAPPADAPPADAPPADAPPAAPERVPRGRSRR